MLEALKFTYQICKQSSRKLLFVTLSLETIQALFLALDTFLLKIIVDSIDHKSIFGLTLVGIITFRLVFQVLKIIIERYTNITWAIFKKAQTLHLNRSFVDKIASLDLSQFENPVTIGLINRVLPRIQWQFSNFLGLVYNALYGLVGMIIPLIVFLTVSPLATFFLVVSNLIVLFVNTSQNRAYFNIFKSTDVERRQFGYIMDLLTRRENLPEIKLFQAFDYVKGKLLKTYKKYINKEINLDRHYQRLMIGAEILPALSAFGFLIVASKQLQASEISTGTFVFIFTNMLVFASSLNTFRRHLSVMNGDSRFIQEIKEFFALKSGISFIQLKNRDQNLKIELAQRLKKPKICIENLCFSYPSSMNQVLNKINLTISYGENLAIVGENGAGKTTLIKLLLRIYEPTEGKISINGINLNLIPETMLYQLYSTLFQDFGKFYLTYKENLELASKRSLGQPEMEKYAKLSNAWEFIKDNKRGFDQQLGVEYSNGIDLSGGQWQRLGISRALAKEAPILILDEPTAAIDAKAEAEIFDRLIKHASQKTMLFISHRFSTIKDAERIAVMQKGQIVEIGTHTQLINQNAYYAKLYNLQASRYQRT